MSSSDGRRRENGIDRIEGDHGNATRTMMDVICVNDFWKSSSVPECVMCQCVLRILVVGRECDVKDSLF